MLRALAAIVAIVCLVYIFWGCSSEDDSTKTRITVAAWLQQARGEEVVPNPADVVVYAHYADTVEWEVASYDDALLGIATHKTTGERLESPVATGVLDMNGEFSMGVFTKSPVMLIACDRNTHGAYASRIFGYRQTIAAPTLETMRLPVIFRPWEPRWKFLDSNWWMINENAPEAETLIEVEPFLQDVSGGAESAYATSNLVVYAYFGTKINPWEVVSYEDALAGVLTNKNTGDKKTVPDVTATPTTDGKMSLGTLSDTQIVLIICDRDGHGAAGSKMYGFRETGAAEGIASRNLKVTFRPWETRGDYYDSATTWTMRNDNPAPETP